MKGKTVLKISLITFLSIVLLVVLTVLSYFIYLYADYSRLDDNLELEIDPVGNSTGPALTDTSYTIMIHNIGYGANEAEYSFFMDGGKYSWAFSEDRLKENIEGIANDIIGVNTDFVMLQEVDVDGTRSYHFNELDYLKSSLGYANYVFAQNYDSPFLFYPLTEPHGSNKAGLLTGTSFNITSSIRKSLPIATSFSKFFDLDRCYSMTRIPVDNGKNLTLINLHLSAYGGNPTIRQQQVQKLSDDMQYELENGNYIIAGGDFNHNLREGNFTDYPDWAQQFPKEDLPYNTTFACEIAETCVNDHDSGRNLDEPYNKNTTFTVLLDGLIVSKNIEVEYYESLDWQYQRSDHDPIFMKFKLKKKSRNFD